MRYDSNGYSPSAIPTEYCYICGSGTDLVRHEVYHGMNRQRSKRMGAWLTLCANCHGAIHSGHIPELPIKRAMQVAVMEKNHMTIDDWHREFGKSYI